MKEGFRYGIICTNKKRLALKNMVSAINTEAECCLDPESRKKHRLILLGTLVTSSNFLLEFS